MKSALCIDQLVLEGVVTSLGIAGENNAEQIPILADVRSVEAKKTPPAMENAVEQSSEDVVSDGSTVAVEEDTALAINPVQANRTLGFFERMVREYILRRDIQQLITKKETQLKQMETLIAAYQEQLLKVIAVLDEEAQQLKSASESGRVEAKRLLADLLITGVGRGRIHAVRSIGLVEAQRNRILQERVVLRRTIIQTRQEECEWLLKSIIAHHEKECEELLAASTAKEFVESGSLHATVAVQITEDDPIFASIDTLFESPPLAKQLQLQLSSVDAVLATMRIRLNGNASGEPAPLLKRASYRERRSTPEHPSLDRRRDLRLGLIEGKRIRSSSDGGHVAEKYERYQNHLRRLAWMLSDIRTRTGSLLHLFIEKLHEDTLTWVQVSVTHEADDADSNQSDPRPVSDQFFVLHQPNDSDGEAITCVAVDTHKLPPPAMITSFVKFLARVVTTEYDLLTTSPRSSASEQDKADAAVADDPCVDQLDQAVLLDCVHEMVFSRIQLITAASAMDEYLLRSSQDEDEPATTDTTLVFPSHWHHSKAQLQQISPTELAFPDEILETIEEFLEAKADDIQNRGFLPSTLALLRTAERESTPRGVVRAVMAGFKMLHRELLVVLSSDGDDGVVSGGGRRLRSRRSSCFLNADVLIPSIVLMISRLPQPQYLDNLWDRVSLVTAFHSAALTDGGEESYYMTCLQAAMEFVHTYEATTVSTDVATAQPCAQCDSEGVRRRHVRIEEVPVPAASTPPQRQVTSVSRQPTMKRSAKSKGWSKTEHDSIKQLSMWISSQPPTDTVSLTDAERFVVPHDLWVNAMHGALDES